MTNIVYYVKDCTKSSFEKLLEKINLDFISQKDFVAIKTHFGEEGNVTYISAEIYLPLIKILKQKNCLAFFTDTNTIYRGKRANAVEHLILAKQHKFDINFLGVPVIIADGIKGNDYVEVEINLNYFKKAKIASNIYYADVLICLSHFKGHMLFGFAGTIKNLGMGCAARPGKYLLHNVLKPKVDITKCILCGKCIKVCPAEALKIENKKVVLDKDKCVGCGECIHICDKKVFSIPWDLSDKEVQERTVEYAYAATKNKKSCLFINFLDNITKDCDCINKKQEILAKDISIVAGYDPVAVDLCSLNIVNNFFKKDIFKELWTQIDYTPQIEYAIKIGLGKKEYKIVEV